MSLLGFALVAMLAGATGPASLELAQAAFFRAEYSRAEALASSVEEPASRGAALFWVGLSRFRQGHYPEALEALDEAALQPNPPQRPAFLFNRAGCLYELGRYAEAESDYAKAAELDQTLAALALVNAAYAALDDGAPKRAAAHAKRALSTGDERAEKLVAELWQQLSVPEAEPQGADAEKAHREGMEAYQAGQYQKARAHFQTARALQPSEGRHLLMDGAAAAQLEERGQAQEALQQALSLKLSAEDEKVARDFLDALSPGLRGQGQGLSVQAEAGAGVDSNVLQSGQGRTEAMGPQAPLPSGSPLLSAQLAAAYRRAWSHRAVESGYLFEQLAYVSPLYSDYSLQQHALWLSAEQTRGQLRLGASVQAEADFTGLSSFRGLQSAGTGTLWLAGDWDERHSTRAFAAWGRKDSLGEEFSYLSGHRGEAGLGHQLRLSGWVLDGRYRFRDERLGAVTTSASSFEGTVCPGGCTGQYLIPLSYRGHGAFFQATGRLFALPLKLGADAGLEWRGYPEEGSLHLTFADGQTQAVNPRRREDLQLSAGLSLALKLGDWAELKLRYGFVYNRSTVANGQAGHLLDYDDKNYTRHLFLVELGAQR